MSMDIDHYLKRVAVVGACGKMGRGIALLMSQEMTLMALRNDLEFQRSCSLYLIDPYEEGYFELKLYLEQQLTRFAEKNINTLREIFAPREDLVSNEEMIRECVSTGMRFVNCSAEFSSLKQATLIFEAAFEEIPLKVKILKEIHEKAPQAFVFTNTSSIPIHLLAAESGLKERLIGFHFYNPPAVQKLVELIPQEGAGEILDISQELTERLKKITVLSRDVAGFIGNGHFSREIALACQFVSELQGKYGQDIAIQVVNEVTKDFLLRPMGIFQLLDYVGLPIASHILHIIRKYVPEPNLEAPLIEEYVSEGLVGGQTPDGAPKDGIFAYQHGKISSIYSLEEKKYVPVTDVSFLGIPPEGLSWKELIKDPELQKKLQLFFEILFTSENEGCRLAVRYLNQSAEIEELLVSTHVAKSASDVGTVLKNGFHHLYSPHEMAVKKL